MEEMVTPQKHKFAQTKNPNIPLEEGTHDAEASGSTPI